MLSFDCCAAAHIGPCLARLFSGREGRPQCMNRPHGPALILGCVVGGGAAMWRMVLRMEGKRRWGVAIEGNLGHHL